MQALHHLPSGNPPLMTERFFVIDALYIGVPMILLISKSGDSRDVDAHPGIDSEFAEVDSDAGPGPGRETRFISTKKLASRVRALLLQAVGLEDFSFSVKRSLRLEYNT